MYMYVYITNMYMYMYSRQFIDSQYTRLNINT